MLRGSKGPAPNPWGAVEVLPCVLSGATPHLPVEADLAQAPFCYPNSGSLILLTTGGHLPSIRPHSTQMQSSLSLKENCHLTERVAECPSSGHHVNHLGGG